jgi:sugar lactone lactonase YvrE
MARSIVLLLLLATALAAQSIRTIAGNGVPGFSATQINNPYGLVVGPDGALYWCDIGNHVIRRLNLKTGAIDTVAGTGEKGQSGEGGLATKALLNEPYELRFDRQGNLFFVDMQNHMVQRIDRRSGIISRVAGTGQPGFSGDGGAATEAQLRQPHSIAFDREGRLLVCDIGNHRVRRIDLRSGLIATYMGTGEKRNAADGAARVGTPLHGPRALDVAKDGRIYIVLREGNALYELDPRTDRYRLLLNSGMKGPKGIAIAPDGSLYIADTENQLVQRVDPRMRTLQPVAGSGERGDGPEDTPRACRMNRPHGVFVDRKGNVYIGDSEAHRIRLLTGLKF